MAKLFALFAEWCNMLSVFIVMSCFFTMVVFLLRLRGEALSQTSVTWMSRRRLPQPMVLVPNPFVFKLNNLKAASLSGIECTVSSQVQWIMHAVWGVHIDKLFQLLNLDWQSLKEMIQSDLLLEGKYICRNEVTHEDICQDKLIKLEPTSEVLDDDLGNVPRLLYPLVVFMVRETELETSNTNNSVVAMVNIIHIRDTLCKMETCIFAQYLKQSSGQIRCLKPLYMLSEADSESNSEQYSASENNSLCVVCQTQQVSIALLPCRHTCVCQFCFQKLDKCPMCRGVIHSFFGIKEGTTLVNQSEGEETVPWESLNWGQRLAQINSRLNEWLGFT